jgi:hypothetical protein
MTPPIRCGGCGGPYHGAKASWERRLCERCSRKERKGKRANHGTFSRSHRLDKGHEVLPQERNARALEMERAPFVVMDHLRTD